MSTEINTNKITCPYCGHEDQGWWNLAADMEDGDVEDTYCQNCGEEFSLELVVSATYISKKKEEKK